jgi:hypothetical protein
VNRLVCERLGDDDQIMIYLVEGAIKTPQYHLVNKNHLEVFHQLRKIVISILTKM